MESEKNRQTSLQTKVAIKITELNSLQDQSCAVVNPQLKVPQTHNKLVGKSHSAHCRELVAYLIFLFGCGLIFGLFICGKTDVSRQAIIGICVGIYVIHLLVGFICNPYFSSFCNIHHGVEFQNEYNKIRNLGGHFLFTAECYHYETGYYTHQIRDTNGQMRTQTYTTQQKVVTHTARKTLNPRTCIDQSGPIQHVISKKFVIFIHNYANYKFSDQQSEAIYKNEFIAFQRDNRRDKYQKYSQSFNVSGLRQRLCFSAEKSLSKYIILFVIGSILGFMWPITIFIEYQICRYDIQFLKVVTL